jgi:hypothetical protein
MLSEGYRSAFWNVIYHEYKNRWRVKPKISNS